MKLANNGHQIFLVEEEAGQLYGIPIPTVTCMEEAIENFETIKEWAERRAKKEFQPIDLTELQAPIKGPRQIFAVGFNYHDHAKEFREGTPTFPNVFTKFQSSLCGPFKEVKLQSEKTDWETELVLVIGRGGRDILESEAEEHIFGYMVGMDLSDRALQFVNGASSQWNLAKSYQDYSPIGPFVVTRDEAGELEQCRLTTKVNQEIEQSALIGEMIFSPTDLVAKLSQIVELYPGDLIFTGTPGGVGDGKTPQQFLQAGDVVVSTVEGLGEIEITCK